MKKQNLEIERKFLLKTFPSGVTIEKIQLIEQYYDLKSRYRRVVEIIPKTPFTIKSLESYKLSMFALSLHNSSATKIRYIKTVKKTISPGVADEQENEITEKQYDKKVNNCIKHISKIRYITKGKKYNWEIDVFNNISFIIAELEVKTKKELKSTRIPETIKKVMVKEVTGDKDFSNATLALPI